MNDCKTVYYVAATLDGFIAREDGAVDWLMNVQGDGDNGYADFYRSVGCIVMGRNTYEEILKLSEIFPYANKPVYVITRTPQPPTSHVHFTNQPLAELLSELKQSTQGHIWIAGGGQLAQHLVSQGLVDVLEVALAPKCLGKGIPLFAGQSPSSWALMNVQTSGQFVLLRYAYVSNVC